MVKVKRKFAASNSAAPTVQAPVSMLQCTSHQDRWVGGLFFICLLFHSCYSTFSDLEVIQILALGAPNIHLPDFPWVHNALYSCKTYSLKF